MSNTDLYISLIVIKDPPNHLRRDRKPEVYPLFWLCAYVLFFLFFCLNRYFVCVYTSRYVSFCQLKLGNGPILKPRFSTTNEIRSFFHRKWRLMLTSNGKSCLKPLISNLVRTTRFWNNLHQGRSRSIDWKDKYSSFYKQIFWKH
jgi:hypothetical protein